MKNTPYYWGGGAILISIIHMYNADFGLMLQKFEAGLWNLMKYWYLYDKFKIKLGFWKEVFFLIFMLYLEWKWIMPSFIYDLSLFFYLCRNRLNRFGNSVVCDWLGLWHYLIWMFCYLEWKFKKFYILLDFYKFSYVNLYTRVQFFHE